MGRAAGPLEARRLARITASDLRLAGERGRPPNAFEGHESSRALGLIVSGIGRGTLEAKGQAVIAQACTLPYTLPYQATYDCMIEYSYLFSLLGLTSRVPICIYYNVYIYIYIRMRIAIIHFGVCQAL